MTEQENHFRGQMPVQSLIDLVQFYTQSGSVVRIIVSKDNEDYEGSIWIDKRKITHSETRRNYGIDAFYEILSWTSGEFRVLENDVCVEPSISKDSTEIILEYYVLVDNKDLPETGPMVRPSGFNMPAIKQTQVIAQPSLQQTSMDGFPKPISRSSVIDPHEMDFSDLNDEKPIKRPQSAHIMKGKIQPLLELDGIVAASLIDLNTGMVLVSHTVDKKIDIDQYGAYAVEVAKSHKKFLSKLHINEKIEDIIINLDKNYHIITNIKKSNNICIYSILRKEDANLAIARLSLMDVVDSF